MEYVQFGRTGLKVSRLCMGTTTFGLQSDEKQSFAILDTALAGGIDFIDTADVYPGGGGLSDVGRTEQIIGRWMKGRRGEVILVTKGHSAMGPKPWQRGNSRKHLLDAVDASLKRLDTDYVDVYLLHADDGMTPLDEILGALDTIVAQGKARYVGVSNWQAHRIARALGRAEVRNLVRIDCVQPRYNLLFRPFERDLLPMCREEGIAVIPYNPLAAGLLTGKHDFAAPPPEGRFGLGSTGVMYRERYWKSREFEAIAAIRTLAGEAGLTMIDLALRWVISNPAITAPIIGASRPEQLADSLRAGNAGPLPADLKAKLDEVTQGFRAIDAVR